MNILYLINFAGKAGTEKYIKNLTPFVKEKGDIVSFCYNIHGPLAEFMERSSVNCHKLSMKSPFDLRAAKKLAQICKTENIDIIHTQFARENYIAILSKNYGNKAGIIHTCHINTPNNFIWKMLNFIFMNKNDKVIAVCNSVKNLLIANNYPSNKVEVIFNGIDYVENIEKTNSLREELGINNSNFIFITLTRFSAEKGIFFLLKAVAELAKSTNNNFALVMAGDGELLEEAKAYSSTNSLEKQVYFLGFRTDAAKLLAASDCFINSSSSEALSFAILEAMGAELPIIATNVGGNPDIINSHTNCGVLVEYDDSHALAIEMQALLENQSLSAKRGANAHAAVKNIFNINTSLERTYKIYKDVVK